MGTKQRSEGGWGGKGREGKGRTNHSWGLVRKERRGGGEGLYANEKGREGGGRERGWRSARFARSLSSMPVSCLILTDIVALKR